MRAEAVTTEHDDDQEYIVAEREEGGVTLRVIDRATTVEITLSDTDVTNLIDTLRERTHRI